MKRKRINLKPPYPVRLSRELVKECNLYLEKPLASIKHKSLSVLIETLLTNWKEEQFKLYGNVVRKELNPNFEEFGGL